MESLQGKVALVTGASAPRGIGRAVALRLAQDGACVVVTDRDGSITTDAGERPIAGLLDGLVAEIRAAGGKAISTQLDVTKPGEVSAAVALAQETFGPITILVSNAGWAGGTGPLLASDPDDWDYSFRVNLQGPLRLCQAVIPGMQEAGGGRIVNMASVHGLGSQTGFGAYGAMKHALIGMTKSIAAEFGPDGITCNAICPGFISTDMHDGVNARMAAAEGVDVADIQARRYGAVALRQAGQVGDIAGAVAWLVGPGGGYVTGVALPVTGGLPAGL